MAARPTSTFRAERTRIILHLKKQGKSSTQIAKEVKLAPSTVRDYLNDPGRAKARRRQRKYGVTGISTVAEMHPPWKKSAPSEKGASFRGRQMQALTGHYTRKGRR